MGNKRFLRIAGLVLSALALGGVAIFLLRPQHDAHARKEEAPSSHHAAQSGDERGWTRLHSAAFRGNTQEIGQLVANGADVLARTNDGDTALYWAVYKQQKGAVVLLLSSGADVNARNRGGDTALHAAAGNGNREIAETLLDYGANVDIQDEIGYTPLHSAAYRGHADVAALLCERGANVLLREHRGQTALLIATGRRHTDVFETLLRYYEPFMDVSDLMGLTADRLVMAVEYGLSEIVEGMLDRNPELISTKNEDGRTLIEIAVREGKHSVVEVLISKGVDVAKVGPGGGTLLSIAAMRGHIRVAEVLIGAGVDVNARTAGGYTALHDAILCARPGVSVIHADYVAMPMVKLLVSKGSDVNATNNKGETPLQLANALKREKVASFLSEHGAK